MGKLKNATCILCTKRITRHDANRREGMIGKVIVTAHLSCAQKEKK